MWIAKDKNGVYNAFIVKPIKNEFSNWSTSPYEYLWKGIPGIFINQLVDTIPALKDCSTIPVEIELTEKGKFDKSIVTNPE